MSPPLLSHLRQRRVATGLSQTELATRVGVSRQALSAIEAGRQVPSTLLALQLARALGCDVGELFSLPAGPSLQARLAGPATSRRVVLGRIDGALVAHPLSDPRHPADGLLEPSHSTATHARVQPLDGLTTLDHHLLIAGCAPLLGLLAARLGRRFRDARATWLSAHSTHALELLERKLVHVAGIHLTDATDPTGHDSVAQRTLPHQHASIVHLARWRQGLVVAPGNPLGLTHPGDLARPDLRIISREAGSGAQRLLDKVLTESSLELPHASHLAHNHAEVARLIRWGVADVGIAIESAALAEGLDFIPLSEERFDLVLPTAWLHQPHIARFIDLVDQPAFRDEAADFPGYDLSHAGHVHAVPLAP